MGDRPQIARGAGASARENRGVAPIVFPKLEFGPFVAPPYVACQSIKVGK
jgi:hypothetical protein